MCQPFLKKYPFMPSEPAVELRFIEKATLLSSSISGILVSLAFCSWHIILRMCSKLFSLIILSSLVKISWDCLHVTNAMFSSPCNHSLFSLVILWMKKFLLLPLINESKYLELLSPTLKHWSCVYCFRILSSNLQNMIYWEFN